MIRTGADTPSREEILEPDLRIIDPHHHLWDRRSILPSLPPVTHPFEQIVRRSTVYLLDQLNADLALGHRVEATVYLECGAMYRADGPDDMKPIGETEFVNGIAAMSASGAYGPARACLGIVGHVDLTLGARAGAILDAHMAAAPARFRGIRHSASWDADPRVLGPLVRRPAGVFLDRRFREGFAELSRRGLSFDAWLLEPQLEDLIDLARSFPDTSIVLDHVGTPLGIASYENRRDERFRIWKDAILALAACPNVHVKLGGLAMPFCGFPSCLSSPRAPSSQLAKEWRPYIETCIEAFGVKRAMFESNFPVDEVSCSYERLWNAFKIITSGASGAEKADLYFNTANRFYRLGLSPSADPGAG
ncbi:MAG: amidohydrolase family protein [Alphaproteobacteria bacterium]|nr:amidohydrolase family protein [Alphaproteobacteria bacterium]